MSKAEEFVINYKPVLDSEFIGNKIKYGFEIALCIQFSEAYHKHEMQQKAEKIKDYYKNGLRLFLQGIRDYERECGQAVCYDERECEEFVNIHLESTDAFDFNEIQKLLEQ